MVQTVTINDGVPRVRVRLETYSAIEDVDGISVPYVSFKSNQSLEGIVSAKPVNDQEIALKRHVRAVTTWSTVRNLAKFLTLFLQKQLTQFLKRRRSCIYSSLINILPIASMSLVEQGPTR